MDERLARRVAIHLAQPDLGSPADHRLAFRELGLAIGLAAESFWLLPEHRQVRTWLDHEDINDVMLATSLVPEGLASAPAGPLSRRVWHAPAP